MRHLYYALNEKHEVVEADMESWAKMFSRSNRRVALTDLPNGYVVSMMFLGLDHSFSDAGPPIVFESMSFPSDDRQLQYRYATWDEAVAGHAEMVEVVRWWTSRHITHFLARVRWRLRRVPYIGFMWRMDRWLKRRGYGLPR